MRRTHTCGELNTASIGSTVTLCGWVANRRDHGGIIFIDMRDRFGLTQLVFDPDDAEGVIEFGTKVRSEWVLQITGDVVARTPETINPKMSTGEIEIRVKTFEVLSKAKVLPFQVDDYTECNEDIRLKYRYLDLRRPRMQKTFVVRHKVLQATRQCLTDLGFLEIETPILGKSTPEGARDYLVPSRVHNGEFYALPQSPQLFKQILMVAGFDRYFQVSRCFRDEDLRADRQPEFTQIDLELSFGGQEDVFEVIEKLMKTVFKAGIDVDLQTPFRRMPYAESMDKYGCDKPDLRFGLELANVGDLVKNCSFKVFTGALENGGIVKAIKGPGMNAYSRKQMDDLAALVSIHGAKGLAYIKIDDAGEYGGPIVKFLEKETIDAICQRVGAGAGDCVMFGADKASVVNPALALLRNHIGKEQKLYDPSEFCMVWITEFPLLEWSEEDNRWESAHHPFTQPLEEDLPLLDKVDEDRSMVIRSSSYDLVLNGVELASGSLRIHDSDIQQKIFRTLKLSEEDITERFGFFVEALQYGTPPHAGIAPGLDRLVAMMLGYENIREVIAFPKTQKATCPMTDAPSGVSPKQLRELGISIPQPPKA